MAILGTIQVRALLDTANFSKRMNTFSRDLQKRGRKIARAMNGFTTLGGIAGGAGLAVGLKNMIGIAADFEDQMQQVRAIMDPMSEEVFGKLNTKVRDLGKSTVFSASQAAKGVDILARNGLKYDQIMGGAIESTLGLASATGADLALAADIATDALNIFGKTTKDLGGVVDQIAGVTKNSKFDIVAYQGALAAGAAAVVKAGRDFEDFNAVLTGTASFFDSGEKAGTAFKVFIDRLVEDSKSAQEAQEKLGISFFESSGKLKSFAEIAEGLKKGLAGLSDEDAIRSLTDQFGTRGANFAVAMARAGAAGIEQAKAAIAQADAAKIAAERLKSFRGQVKLLKSAFDEMSISISGGTILDGLTKITGKFTDFLKWVTELPRPVQMVAIGFAGLGAALPAVALGVAAVGLGLPALVTGFTAITGFLLGPWGIALTAAIGLGILFKDSLVKAFKAAADFIGGALGSIRDRFNQWASEHPNQIEAIVSKWDLLKTKAGELRQKLSEGLGGQFIERLKGLKAHLDEVLQPIGGLNGAFELLIEKGFDLVNLGIDKMIGGLDSLMVKLPEFLDLTKRTGDGMAEGLKTGISFFLSIPNLIKGAFAGIAEFFKPQIEAVKALVDIFQSWFGFIKENILLVTDLAKWFGQLTGIIGKSSEATDGAKEKTNLLGKAVLIVIENIKAFGSAVKNTVTNVLAAFSSMATKGAQLLDGFTNTIRRVRAAIRGITTTGEQMEKDAVKQSWLKDFALLGTAYFQGLIRDGIAPTIGALKGLTGTGNMLANIAWDKENNFLTYLSDALQTIPKDAEKAADFMERNLSRIRDTFQQGGMGTQFGAAVYGDRIKELSQGMARGKVNQGDFDSEMNGMIGKMTEVQKWWVGVTDTMSGEFKKMLKNGKADFDGFADALIARVGDIAADSAMNALFRDGPNQTGLFGSLLGGIGKSVGGFLGLKSFDGGGATGTGPRTGGLDGKGGFPAVLHPNETVVDHTKGQQFGSPNLSVPITLMPGVSREELSQILPEVQRQIIQIIPELISRGGRYSDSYQT